MIYSVFARNHCAGGLESVRLDVPRMADLGVDYIWLMPFHPVGEENRKGSLGSPYAIRDYRAVDPRLGTMDDFVRLADAAHRHGLRLMIDVVYNHVSPDSVIAVDYPEWLWRDADGRSGPRFGGWSDVVDLDYSNRDLWQYQTESLAMWLELGVDGFRCDVAGMIPMSFWTHAREVLDLRFGRTLWLAESIDEAFARGLADAGVPVHTEAELFGVFDLCYDYATYPGLRAVHAGELEVSDYLEAKARQYRSVPEDRGFAGFLENHDQERSASFVDPTVLPAWLAMALLSPGAAIVYAGQEYGATHTLSLFEPDPISIPDGESRMLRPDPGSAVSPRLFRELTHLRRGATGPVTMRAVDQSGVVLEWGPRRRSAVVLDLSGTLRTDDSWPWLPGLVPDGAVHHQDEPLAAGVALLTYSVS